MRGDHILNQSRHSPWQSPPLWCLLFISLVAATWAWWMFAAGDHGHLVPLPPEAMHGIAAQPPFRDYSKYTEVVRHVGELCTVDIFVPRNRNGVPVLFVQSCGWWSGREDASDFCRPLLDAGFTVFSCRHRNLTDAKLEDLADDVCAAIWFARSRALMYGCDERRLVAFGWSSGGHLAMVTAPRAHVSAVIAWSPVTDFTGWNPPGAARFTQGIAPIDYAREMPPTLIVHGTEDAAVPIEQSRDYAKASGCALHEIVGANHSFVTEQEKAEAWRISLEWLAQMK